MTSSGCLQFRHAAEPARPAERPPTDPHPARPRIPPRAFWQKVNDHHELMWDYRGSTTLRIGGQRWDLRQGDALWVPAGSTHAVTMDAESLLLTVGVAHGNLGIGLDDLVTFAFPHSAESLLLHTMLSEYTLFRPDTARGALTRMLLREQLAIAESDQDRSTGALGAIAAALHRDPADPRSLAEWAAHLRVPADRLAAELATVSDGTFPRWRSRVRMDVARDILRSGIPPSQAFRRLGFSSHGAFSRAFTRAHGLTPTDYQRREARTTD